MNYINIKNPTKNESKILKFLIVFAIIMSISVGTAFAIPDPPTNLTATAQPGQKIKLDWDYSSETPDGFQIERESPVGGGWSILVADTGNKKTFYTDNGLAMNTVYNYRVSTIINSEISTTSNEASANTSDAGVLSEPTPPRDLSAIGGNNRVSLIWVEPNPRGSPITDYVIEFSHNDGNTWQLYEDGQNTETALTVVGLSADHYYVFRVYAVNDIGTSNFSEIIERTFNEEKDSSSSFVINGIGFYKINTVNLDNPYSKILLGVDVDSDGQFHKYIPYSQHTDITDSENYGKFDEYEKRGNYFKTGEETVIPTFYGETNQPIQFQIRLTGEFASTKIEHVSMFLNNYGKVRDAKFADTEIIYDKGKSVQIKDPSNLIKDVKMSSSLEDSNLWVNFDIIFEKPMKKSDIFIQAWSELRIPTMSKIFEAIEISDSKTPPQEKQISLTADVEITHDMSSPVCRVDDSCYSPYDAEILENGIVTWTNKDSVLHEVTSGTYETGEDHRFEGYLMPGKIFQHTFKNPGIYKYFCEIHPWARGIITVVGEQGVSDVVEYDETKPAILVASTSSGGSVLVENNDTILLMNQDLRFNISGHVQETTKAKNVQITIILPDDSTQEISTSTNSKGHYSIPTILSKKWQDGVYTIISKYKGDEIGRVSFTITDKKQSGFEWILPSKLTPIKNIIDSFVNGKISENQFDEKLQFFGFPADGINFIKNRLNNMR